ncbi:MAG: Uma2 family endonuclease [Chloroflexi bacterium]|nr:Uma2 family endonuclease [Chloroflexota bacterium]MCI0576447.1 Uma2 family endonuclease [Chloroflexota bacterium]MCI0647269.1 Uma2 family endonuclease [Chloroflexota bacterium]MCI0729308.1 Uma2 family endonuclease [Chloroflexota bacterium]
MAKNIQQTAPTVEPSADILPEPERGWRYVRETLPDGRELSRMVPLTPYDFLNPKEGDVMPQRPFHERATRDLADMLQAYFADNPNITVFHDLIFNWDISGLANPSPDIAVVPNVRNPQDIEGEFNVAVEGTRPILIIEVVSPHYRKEDRRDKVEIYAQAGVQEYVILDRWERRGQTVNEVLGYELEEGRYWPIPPDDDGFILCRTVGLRIGLEEDRAVLLNATTGERLRTYAETKAALSEAEARLAALEAELRQLREK